MKEFPRAVVHVSFMGGLTDALLGSYQPLALADGQHDKRDAANIGD